MPERSEDCLTEQHLRLFGGIVHWFARHEILMEDVMSAVSGASRADVMLLTRRLDFNAKREALLDLLRHHGTPVDKFDRICAYLLVPHTQMSLWRDIAHSTWRPGRHLELIQPNWILNLPATIRPITDDLDEPSERQMSRDDRELTYSIQDLQDVEGILAANYRALSEFLHEAGLLPAASGGRQAAHSSE
ncbi:hypothetical protein [Cupriavidus sp. BIS7]|uniref:hypothetical protein n=1 Tax=Cupriavidus sp. BIS7 TaxID=1217718 RepID=UPI00030841F1|nr:hypothetical protein [Cupriavidus sp. BIS7]